MNTLPTRCLTAADTLRRVAHGINPAPQYTRAQVIEQGAELFGVVEAEIRANDMEITSLRNHLMLLHAEVARLRTPWWRRAWRAVCRDCAAMAEALVADFGRGGVL